MEWAIILVIVAAVGVWLYVQSGQQLLRKATTDPSSLTDRELLKLLTMIDDWMDTYFKAAPEVRHKFFDEMGRKQYLKTVLSILADQRSEAGQRAHPDDSQH